MKKMILQLMILVMLILAVPTTDVQAAGSNKKAYKAYANWLNKKAPSQYKKFTLVKLDGDKVPELVGQYKDRGMEYYIICSYDGKKVRTKELAAGVAMIGGFRGAVSYIPKKGKILETYIYGGTGAGNDTVYQLKKGKFKKAASGSSQYNSRGKQTFKWGKKKVNGDTYNNNLNKAFNHSKEKSFADLKYISKSNMKKKLR